MDITSFLTVTGLVFLVLEILFFAYMKRAKEKSHSLAEKLLLLFLLAIIITPIARGSFFFFKHYNLSFWEMTGLTAFTLTAFALVTAVPFALLMFAVSSRSDPTLKRRVAPAK